MKKSYFLRIEKWNSVKNYTRKKDNDDDEGTLPRRQERIINHIKEFLKGFDEQLGNELGELIPKMRELIPTIPMASFKNGPGLLVGYYLYTYSGIEKPEKSEFRKKIGIDNFLETQDIHRYERFWEGFFSTHAEGRQRSPASRRARSDGKNSEVSEEKSEVNTNLDASTPARGSALASPLAGEVQEFGGYEEVIEEYD